MSERKFAGMDIWYAADGGGGGGKAPDPKDVARDASIHRSSHLINGTPLEHSQTQHGQHQEADTSETGMGDILASLQRLTGFVPPVSGGGSSSGESEESGS